MESKLLGYLSSISLEMYLAHMVVFRAIERCRIVYALGNGWLSFILTFGLTIGGLIMFIEAFKRIQGFIIKMKKHDENELKTKKIQQQEKKS